MTQETKGKLYFIESIHHPDYEKSEERRENQEYPYTIIMEPTYLFAEHEGQQNNEELWINYDILEFNELPIFSDAENAIQEGQFVYYNEENKQFSHAPFNAVEEFLHEFRHDWIYLIERSQRNKLNENNWLTSAYPDKCDITSYHVYVGCANCSFILFKGVGDYQLWMVDCGVERNNNRLLENIDKTITQIASDINIKKEDVRIHRFMLTHWHSDHINGIYHLINKKHITKDTECIMNLYYVFPSTPVRLVINKLRKLGVEFYEPTTHLESPLLKILHPNGRAFNWPEQYKRIPCWHWFYSLNKFPKYPWHNYIEIPKINNSSVVYAVGRNELTMIFPGDLEKEGFDRMTKSHTCRCLFHRASYYCVSHHGSNNGHINIACLSGPCNTVIECKKTNLKHAIIMGRDTAYSGIYDSQVLQDWGALALFTEYQSYTNKTPIKALILDWKTGTKSYI